MTRLGAIILIAASGFVLIRAALAAGERRVTAFVRATGDGDETFDRNFIGPDKR